MWTSTLSVVGLMETLHVGIGTLILGMPPGKTLDTCFVSFDSGNTLINSQTLELLTVSKSITGSDAIVGLPGVGLLALGTGTVLSLSLLDLIREAGWFGGLTGG